MKILISLVACLAAGGLAFWSYSRYCSKEKADLIVCLGMCLLISAFVYILFS